jgi:hypothetical protein
MTPTAALTTRDPITRNDLMTMQDLMGGDRAHQDTPWAGDRPGGELEVCR